MFAGIMKIICKNIFLDKLKYNNEQSQVINFISQYLYESIFYYFSEMC